MSAKQAVVSGSISRLVRENARKACLALLLSLITLNASALTPIQVLETTVPGPRPTDSDIDKAVRAHIDTAKYREVRVQIIRDDNGNPSHYLVYLFSRTSHRVDFARINIDRDYKVLSVQQNYKLQDMDLKQQPGGALKK
jgi:hypothetical protein